MTFHPCVHSILHLARILCLGVYVYGPVWLLFHSSESRGKYSVVQFSISGTSCTKSLSFLPLVCWLFLWCNIRTVLWEQLSETIPGTLLKEIDIMQTDDKSAFIISCLNNTFTFECLEMYNSIVIFIHDMYTKRCNMLQPWVPNICTLSNVS